MTRDTFTMEVVMSSDNEERKPRETREQVSVEDSDPMGCPSYGPQVEPTPNGGKDAPPEDAEVGEVDVAEKIWDILFDAREVLAVNMGEGWQDALADIVTRIARLQKGGPIQCPHCKYLWHPDHELTLGEYREAIAKPKDAPIPKDAPPEGALTGKSAEGGVPTHLCTKCGTVKRVLDYYCKCGYAMLPLQKQGPSVSRGDIIKAVLMGLRGNIEVMYETALIDSVTEMLTEAGVEVTGGEDVV